MLHISEAFLFIKARRHCLGFCRVERESSSADGEWIEVLKCTIIRSFLLQEWCLFHDTVPFVDLSFEGKEEKGGAVTR